ncbi:hypothetical protein KL909_004672 [Ogataea angusta]|nr:hypothetical protein KL909_004672 [Ogataea angusta]
MDKPKFKRNYLACLNCRTRKVKCDLGSLEAPHDPPCARCKRERKECVFAESRRRGSGRTRQDSPLDSRSPSHAAVSRSSSRLAAVGAGEPGSGKNHVDESANTSNSTMVFLAHIAGNFAKADDRDKIDAYERLQDLENKVVSRPSSESPSSEKYSFSESADSAKLPSSASTDSLAAGGADPSTRKEAFGHDTSLHPLLKQSRLHMPPVRSTLKIRPRPTSRLEDIEYIGPDKVLTSEEATRLIRLFFITMHPFFPYIPAELQDPQVLPGYPMLLCSILTISSRYHPLEAQNRHIEIHEQLWVYCQRLISMTVWGESSSRSIGTLLSFLLFTEWNPRAIHFRWSDYANMPDDEGQEEYTGLSAMKRSEIMSFMLIGTATRLSFLLDEHPLTFLATHISETHSAINLNKRSMLSQTLGEVDINDPSFDFTPYQKATIELLQFTSLCYESLYVNNPKLGVLDKHQNLAVLDILSPLLENWFKKYHKLLKPSSAHNLHQNYEDCIADAKVYKEVHHQVEKEALILDYYYAKLYVYSLALNDDTSMNITNTSKKGRSLRLDELAKYSRYVELAYKAAKEVLAVMQRVNKLRLLKYMPVRWVIRVIKAVAFIVKCYLTLTTDGKADLSQPDKSTSEIIRLSVIPVEEIILLLQKTAICLRDAAPDELHLCTRYSTILMYLCSQFKTKAVKTRTVVDYEDEINSQAQNEEQPQNSYVENPEYLHLNNLDQQSFDDYFTNPSETLFNWFSDNNNPGLDFVDQFTKEIENEFLKTGLGK